MKHYLSAVLAFAILPGLPTAILFAFLGLWSALVWWPLAVFIAPALVAFWKGEEA